MKKLTVPIGHTETILGLCYIVLQVLILPVTLSFLNTALPKPLSDGQLNFANFALNFICITVIFRQYLISSLRIVMLAPGQFIRYCITGFLLYWFCSILVSMLVLTLDPAFSNVNDDTIAVMNREDPLLMGVGTVILVPVVEETLYRGVVFGKLYRKSSVVAYLVSVAVFSGLHVLGYIGFYDPFRLILCFLQYIPAGVFLARTYVKADTIWAPILIHMAVNLIGILAMK